MNILYNYIYEYYPFTTASYLELATTQIHGAKPLRTTNMQDEKIDLVVNVMPCDSIIRINGVPTVYWEIDDHLVRGRKTDFYAQVDIVYIPQEPFIEYYPKNKTKILPLGVDPNLHKPIPEIAPIYDIGFIGNDTYPERRYLLDRLERKFNLMRTNTPPGLPYSEALAKCKLTFNRSLDRDVNMRWFEAMASGRLLLSDYLPQQALYADDGVHYVSYTDWTDLEAKVEYYLTHDEEREKIGKAGQEHVHANHTYRHRLEQILKDTL